MNWFDRWLYGKVRDMWDNRHKYEDNNMAAGQKAYIGTALEKGSIEGDDTIRFELSTAIGGKILTVRRYDRRVDRNDTATYVIPNGENLSERMVKILDLESFK